MKGKRNQSDTVFRMLFKDKRHLLSLYNAVSGRNCTDPDELEITTLENAVYMNRKNDLSFILHDELCLYEHQSTVNPNMPLRDLLYVTDVLKKQIDTKRLYRRKAVELPVPHFLIFYNGKEFQEAIREYKLSDLYAHEEDKPALELIVRQININAGNNQELKENCQILSEYQQYVECVRRHAAETGDIRTAVPLAVDECIENGILKEFLLDQKKEVSAMSIYEFDEEEYLEMIREDARADGHEEGRVEGRKEGREEGRVEGRMEGAAAERANTERERVRANTAEARNSLLEARLLEAGIDPASVY